MRERVFQIDSIVGVKNVGERLYYREGQKYFKVVEV